MHIWFEYKKPFLIMLCVALQYLLSSLLWNYFILQYHILLETDALTRSGLADINKSSILITQNQILKSPSMLMVFYFWRLINPQTMTQYQLLAFLYSKECQLVRNMNEDWGFRNYLTLHELIFSRNNAQGVELELCKMNKKYEGQ